MISHYLMQFVPFQVAHHRGPLRPVHVRRGEDHGGPQGALLRRGARPRRATTPVAARAELRRGAREAPQRATLPAVESH